MKTGTGTSGPCSLPPLYPEHCTSTCFSEFAKDKECSTRKSPDSNPSHSPRVGVGDVDRVCCCKLVTCPALCRLDIWSLPCHLGRMATQGQSMFCFLQRNCALSQRSDEALTIKMCICSAFLSPSVPPCGLYQATLLNSKGQRSHNHVRAGSFLPAQRDLGVWDSHCSEPRLAGWPSAQGACVL